MHRTKEPARRPAAGTDPEAGADPHGAPPSVDERARARAYLDRWEHHLVRLALDGPDRPRGRPKPG